MKGNKFWVGLVLAFSVMAVGCQAQEPQKNAPTASQNVKTAPQATVVNITGDEYLKLKAENPALQLLDVRTPEEISEGFIEGSVKIDVNDPSFTEKTEKNLEKSEGIAVYCRAGGRSARAAEILAQQGFSKVYNITGGITTWMAEGKPTVK